MKVTRATGLAATTAGRVPEVTAAAVPHPGETGRPEEIAADRAQAPVEAANAPEVGDPTAREEISGRTDAILRPRRLPKRRRKFAWNFYRNKTALQESRSRSARATALTRCSARRVYF